MESIIANDWFRIGVSKCAYTVVVLLFLFAVLAALAKRIKQDRQTLSEYIRNLSDIKLPRELVGEDGKTGLAIDSNRRKVALVSRRKGKIVSRIVDFRDILRSEVTAGQDIVARAQRNDQTGIWRINELIESGVIEGDEGAPGTVSDYYESWEVSLNIYINNPDNPIHRIHFLDYVPKDDDEEDERERREAIENALHWHKIVSEIITHS